MADESGKAVWDGAGKHHGRRTPLSVGGFRPLKNMGRTWPSLELAGYC